MRKLLVIAAASLLASGTALAMKPCAELKSEIAAQLYAKGVVAYSLTIVPNEQVGGAQVVGSCDGGTQKITYERGNGAAPPPPAPPPAGATAPSGAAAPTAKPEAPK